MYFIKGANSKSTYIHNELLNKNDIIFYKGDTFPKALDNNYRYLEFDNYDDVEHIIDFIQLSKVDIGDSAMVFYNCMVEEDMNKLSIKLHDLGIYNLLIATFNTYEDSITVEAMNVS